MVIFLCRKLKTNIQATTMDNVIQYFPCDYISIVLSCQSDLRAECCPWCRCGDWAGRMEMFVLTAHSPHNKHLKFSQWVSIFNFLLNVEITLSPIKLSPIGSVCTDHFSQEAEKCFNFWTFFMNSDLDCFLSVNPKFLRLISSLWLVAFILLV